MKLAKPKLDILMCEQQITQQELAEKAGIARQTISYASSGKNCNNITASKIAKALGVSVTQIIKM